MGKKTIKVPFVENIDKVSVFSQNREDLLNIYSEVAMRGMYGCIIVPFEHSDGGHFLYKKDLGNGEMLVCGECYPYDDEKSYNEALYYLDEDYEPGSVFFVDEPSLKNDDDDEVVFNEDTKQKQNEYKMQQELQKLEKSKPVILNETRVYIVDVNKSNMIGMATSDEEFVTEAEKQGTVYTLEGFEKAFNYDDIDSDSTLIRIIKKI